MEEIEYEILIEWFSQHSHYNAMFSCAKEVCDIYPGNAYTKLLLSIAYMLNNKIHEAVKETTNLIQQGNYALPAMIVQNIAYRFMEKTEKSFLMQLEANIHEERRKATPEKLAYSAFALLLLSKPEKAYEYVDRAYKLSPSKTEVLIIRGWVELYLFKKDFSAKDTKINYFDQVLKENKTHCKAQLGSAIFKYYQKDYSGAVTLLNSLIVHYPKIHIFLIEKMINQLAMKNWEEVLEISNRISSFDSNNTDAIKVKAFISLCRDGDQQESLKLVQLLFRNLVLVEPKNADLLLNNVELFSRISGDNQAVLTELARVTEKMLSLQNVKNTELMIQLGNIYIFLNKIKDAERWYRTAVSINESSLEALTGLAYCQFSNTSPDALELARQQVNFLMEIHSNAISPELLYMAAKLYRNDQIKFITYLDQAAQMLLRRCENMPYGYEFLKELNPSLCMKIATERTIYSPQTAISETSNSVDALYISLLEKITDSYPSLSSALLLLSKSKMQRGQLEEATMILKKLIETVDSNNAQAHLLMAQLLVQQGHFESASQNLEVGLSHNFRIRDNPIYHLITGIIQKQEGDLQTSIESFESALAFARVKMDSSANDITQISISDKASIYLELISAYYKLHRFKEALNLVDEAKNLFSGTPEKSKIIIGTAELHLELGEIDKAIDYLSRVQPDDPYYLPAHTRLAEVHLKYRKDHEAFSKCYRELVEQCPGYKTYSMLGDAYIEIQEPERAIEAYEEALKQNPIDKISIASKMGKALVKTHQYAKAIEYYKELIKQDNCKTLKSDLAILFMKMRLYDKAESTLVKQLQDSRGDNDLHSLSLRTQQLLLVAKIRELAGNKKAALITLKEAKENQLRLIQRLALSPDVSNQKEILIKICLNSAEHASALREYDQAILHYKEALNYKPSDTTALLSLAKLHMQMNNLDRCAQTCTALLGVDPDNEIASIMMADLAFRKIDFETAAYHFRQLLLRKPTYWTALARLIEVSRRTGNMSDLNEWIVRAETENNAVNRDAGFYYCSGLLEWRTGKLNSALRNFNLARRDPEWGQQAIYNMIEICLDPDDDSSLSNDAFNDENSEYQDSRTMALKTAYRLLQELNPKGSAQEILTHRLLSNFFLLATKQKSNIEKALMDCTALASQEALRDHVGPALGMATAHILLKQTPRARNHLKRVSKNLWTFEDAEYLERCWLLLADIYVQSNKYDLANELLKKVLQHNATCVKAHELSGHIAEKDQNYREAASRYNQAWTYGGKSKLSVGYKLAYCYFKAKAHAEAIDTCNEVLKLNPDYPRIKKDILEKSIQNIRT